MRDEYSAVTMPAKALKAFARISLEPGEKRTVRFVLFLSVKSLRLGLRRKLFCEAALRRAAGVCARNARAAQSLRSRLMRIASARPSHLSCGAMFPSAR
jgi:hypothetical protein